MKIMIYVINSVVFVDMKQEIVLVVEKVFIMRFCRRALRINPLQNFGLSYKWNI